jgi:hypothetical protein
MELSMDEQLLEQPGAPEAVAVVQEGEPLPEGVSAAPPVDVSAEIQRHMLRVSQSTGLTDLAEDYVFFTHGLLFTHAYWPQDPIVTYIIESQGACTPFHIQVPRPVFKWFDAKDPTGRVLDDQWNWQLCGVPKEQWPGLFAFLAQLNGINYETKFYHQVVFQKIPIVDTLRLEKLAVLPAPVPTVDCICLAVLTNRRTVYFAPQHRRQPWEPVPVMIKGADNAVCLLADQLLQRAPKPMAGITEPTQDVAEAILKGKTPPAPTAAAERPLPLGITDEELRRQFSLPSLTRELPSVADWLKGV